MAQPHPIPSLSALHLPPAQFSIALGICHMISSHLHAEAEQGNNPNLSIQGEPTNTA